MDPTDTLMAIFENLADLQVGGDADPGEQARGAAVHHLRSLADWLDRGGFPPNVEEAIRNTFGPFADPDTEASR